MALSFTVFFSGCGADAVDPPDTLPPGVEFKEVELGDFNTWGGGVKAPGSASQQGWATDGFKWTDGGTATAKSLGYELEDFQKARYLVLEFEKEGTVQGGLHIIWGGYSSVDTDNAALGGWNSTQVVSNNGDAVSPYAKKEGAKLTVDITTLNSYVMYKSPTAEAIRLIIAFYSPDVKSLEIKKAYLQVPTDDAFVPVESITLPAGFVGFAKANIVLDSTLSPSTATNQTVIWSIMGWLPDGSTDTSWTSAATDWMKTTGSDGKPDASNIAALKAIIDFIDLPDGKKTVLIDDSVYPWVYEDTPVVYGKSKNTMFTEDLGKVKIKAIVIDGDVDADGKIVNYEKEFDIDVKPLNAQPALKFGASGAGNTVVKKHGDDVTVTYETNNSGYTMDPGVAPGFGWTKFYTYFQVTLAPGKTLKDYPAISFKIEGIQTNATSDSEKWKGIHIYASNDEFDGDWVNDYAALYFSTGGDDGGYNGYSGNPVEEKVIFFDLSKVDDTCNGNIVCISIAVNVQDAAYKITDVQLLAGF
jgi:hypothetical protein